MFGRLKKRLYEEDSGEIMLESTIIITIVLLLLIVMLSMGFVYYQKAMLTSVANEIASDIGANYKYLTQEDQALNNMTFDDEDLKSLGKFRATFNIEKVKNSSIEKANDYIAYRVGLTNLGINRKEPQIDSAEISVDGVGRMHVKVKVSIETDFLFSNVLQYLDIIPDVPRFTAVGTAECLDVSAYYSYVDFVEHFTDKLAGDDTLIGKITGVVNTVRGWFISDDGD